MLSDTLRALAEPHRLRMLDALRGGPQPVAALSAAVGLGQPQTSKHLGVLRRAGLVAVTPDGQRRLYAFRAAPLRELDEWLDRYRAVLEDNYSRLDALLERGEDTSPTKNPKRSPMRE